MNPRSEELAALIEDDVDDDGCAAEDEQWRQRERRRDGRIGVS
jgi:hypothetical protein